MFWKFNYSENYLFSQRSKVSTEETDKTDNILFDCGHFTLAIETRISLKYTTFVDVVFMS